MSKPKVALYWCASCGGCEETIVDLAEDVLKVVDAVDIALWPVALDFKLKDVKAWEPGEVAVAFINGAIRLSEQEEWVKLLRDKCSLVVAFGSCAHLGGIPGLANDCNLEDIFANKYHKSPTIDNPNNLILFDVKAVFDELNSNGGVDFGTGSVNADFATGGFFSLDGIHPTARGYAVLSNLIIDEINNSFGANVYKVDPATYSTVFLK